MAITLATATGVASSAGTTLTTGSITVASGNSLILGVEFSDSAAASVTATFNSGAQSFSAVDNQTSGNSRLYVLEIASPSAGSGTVTVNWTTSCFAACVVVVVSGAASGASYRDTSAKASGNSTAPTVTITSETNDLALAFMGNKNTTPTFTADASPVSEVTRATSSSGASHVRCVLLTETGAASTSPSGTIGSSALWSMIGANVNLAAAGSGLGSLLRGLSKGSIVGPTALVA